MTILSATAVAAYLGVLCAISPCPLATNIAAVGFVSRGLSPVRTLLGGLLYATGRAAVYVLIAVALVSGIVAAPELSHVLQKHMNRAMGPILVIVAAVLLGLIRLPSFGADRFSAVQKRLANSGIAGAFLLGAFFALAFCPTSAALYFGSLLPLAIDNNSPLLLSSVFGVASALPVVMFSLLIAAGLRKVGSLFGRISMIEKWLRLITGVGFLVVGTGWTLKGMSEQRPFAFHTSWIQTDDLRLPFQASWRE